MNLATICRVRHKNDPWGIPPQKFRCREGNKIFKKKLGNPPSTAQPMSKAIVKKTYTHIKNGLKIPAALGTNCNLKKKEKPKKCYLPKSCSRLLGIDSFRDISKCLFYILLEMQNLKLPDT